MSRIYKTANSTQYIRAVCTGANDDGPVDLTTLPVAFAFTPVGSLPQEGDWVAGTWVVDGGYKARIKVGPEGDIDLAATDWTVWVQITTADETPQMNAGLLVVGEGTS